MQDTDTRGHDDIGRHAESDTALYEEIINEASAVADVANLSQRSSRLRIKQPLGPYGPRQLTIYGSRHRGTYRDGETTKLRITSSDPATTIQVIGLTGNNEETFEIRMTAPARSTLGEAGFLGLSALREGINLMIEEL